VENSIPTWRRGRCSLSQHESAGRAIVIVASMSPTGYWLLASEASRPVVNNLCRQPRKQPSSGIAVCIGRSRLGGTPAEACNPSRPVLPCSNRQLQRLGPSEHESSIGCQDLFSTR